jgi:hypothetical protein
MVWKKGDRVAQLVEHQPLDLMVKGLKHHTDSHFSVPKNDLGMSFRNFDC